MGKEQNGNGKHFYLFLAFVILAPVLLSGCAHLYEKIITWPDFEQAENLARQGNYPAAAARYEQILIRHPQVGDRVLFQIGLMNILPQNKRKDYHKALDSFQRLAGRYPESRYRPQSDIFISLLAEIAGSDRKVSTQNKQIDRLEQQLEQMKEVDMNLKQKKQTLH